jgi:hypothetical protein
MRSVGCWVIGVGPPVPLTSRYHVGPTKQNGVMLGVRQKTKQKWVDVGTILKTFPTTLALLATRLRESVSFRIA